MKKFLPYTLAATMLIAGFFIGTFTVGRITRNKIERFSSVRSPENFKYHMIHDLDLTTEQQELIDPILEEHSENLRMMTKKFRDSFDAEQEKLHTQLDPILTDEQKEKMKQKKQEFQRGFKKDRRGGPGDHRNRDFHEERGERNDRPQDGPPPEHRRD